MALAGGSIKVAPRSLLPKPLRWHDLPRRRVAGGNGPRQSAAAGATVCLLGMTRRSRNLRRSCGQSGNCDEDGLLWLNQEVSYDPTGEVLELPVLPVEDVYLPGAPVTLQVTDDGPVRQLYDELLLSGGRYVACVLFSEERQEMAAVGTLLYLEDFRRAGQGHIAEHSACGRVRLMPKKGFRASEAQRMEVEILEDDVEISDHNPATTLEPQLSQLERLRKKRGITSGLKESLQLPPELPRELQAVQGLWQVKSGLRVRIDEDQVVGLGKLAWLDGRLVVQLDKPFTGRIEGDDDVADTLIWDDGDVWQRLAAPAPCGTSPHQNALWRAARHWRSTGTLRAELRRGEARWKSAASMTEAGEERPWDPKSKSREAWQSAANAADEAAKTEMWEEVLRPCQRLLQAKMAQRLEIFRSMLQAEITRLQLMSAVDPK